MRCADKIAMVQTAILAGGLLAGFYQLNALGQQIGDGTSAGVASQTIELNKMFLENEKLRPYFYDGKDITQADGDFMKANAMATLVLDYFDYVYPYAIGERASKIEEPERCNAHFTFVVNHSTIICRRQNFQSDQFVKEFSEFCIKVCRSWWERKF